MKRQCHDSALIAALVSAAFPNVCNPYTDVDPALERPDAAAVRLANLGHYLRDRRNARIAVIGEAAGYRGCRFTGIPFTCEAQLRAWNDARYRTTSVHGDHDERSARCVWQTLTGGRGFSRLTNPAEASASTSASDVILWNVFPWHPHLPGQPLSNRQPSAAELRAGLLVLKLFLEWKRPERVFAVGRIAERALRALDRPATYLRHPSHGGQRAFQSALNCALQAQFPTPDQEPTALTLYSNLRTQT